MADLNLKCRVSGKNFVITEWEQDLLRRMKLPLPTLCPDERLRRRLAHRNERRIYKDKCDLTGNPIISLYSSDKPYKVYSQDVWWSDDWDPKEYGRDYDFNRPFFEQFHELQLAVPRFSLMNMKAENSEYCNITTSNKNCYLVFGGDFNEDCMYDGFCFHSQDLYDTYWVEESRLSYELIDCVKMYESKYCRNSQNCRDSAFLFDCRSCSNCAFCVGLRNKEYHIFNKKYSKEEYETKMKEYDFGSYSAVERMKAEFDKFRLGFPHKFANLVNVENSFGDNLVNAKNAYNCFDISGPAEDLKDVYLAGWGIKDAASSDHVGHEGCELFYEMLGSISGVNCAYGSFVWHANDTRYCDTIAQNSHDLFGCSNMKKASYCILNKQYSKEDYFEMRARIIEHMKSTGEWGEFFPMNISPWAYNETVANDLFPMNREEVSEAGLNWVEEEEKEIENGEKIPDSIDDVGDDILSKNLVCEKSGRPYKINEKELKFYRRMKIPIPRLAPETRNEVRLSVRNPHKVWTRKCDKCGVDIKTSYAPDRPETVYCEKCYNEAIYG